MRPLARALLLLPMTLAGCGGNQPAPPATAPTPTATAPASMPAVPFDERQVLAVGGAARRFILHPSAIDGSKPERFPLVIFLHGAGDDAAYAYQAYGLPELADRARFIAAFPDSRLTHWDAQGTVRGHSDDEAFLSALIAKIKATLPVDDRRVYLAGHSNGAVMAAAYGARHSDEVAAIGLVAGSAGWETATARVTVAKPARPLPVMIVHGQKDPNLPFAPPPPGADFQAIGPEESVAFWVAADRCTPTPRRETLVAGRVLHTTYRPAQGDAEVTAYFLTEGNHMWPGARTMPGKTQIPSADLATTEIMWAFFQQHPLPAK